MHRLPRSLDRPLLRYVLSGGLAACVDLGMFLLLIAQGLVLPLATVASFLVAMLVNFLVSARFVFGTVPSWRRLAAFALFASLGLLFNSGLTIAAAALGVTAWLAKCCGIGGAFVFNYTVNAWIVFRR